MVSAGLTPFSILFNVFPCLQASGDFRRTEVSLDGLFAAPSQTRRDHLAAPSPGIDSSAFPTNMVWPSCPPTNLVEPLLGLSIRLPLLAVTDEVRLPLLPLQFTLLRYLHDFTTLLLYSYY